MIKRNTIQWYRRSYTEEQFRKVIAENNSANAALLALNAFSKIVGRRTFRQTIETLEIDTSHWAKKPKPSLPEEKKNKGKDFWFKQQPISLEELLVEKSDYNTNNLKKRLIKANYFEYKCSVCEIDSWLGKPLVLRLDHINGINNDHRLENLRLICPNCDSQSPTFCGRNMKKPKEEKLKKIEKIKLEKELIEVLKAQDCLCIDCSKPINKISLRCRKCASKNDRDTKIIWPPTKELIQMVEDSSYLAVGRQLGVSDNAIRNRIYRHPNE